MGNCTDKNAFIHKIYGKTNTGHSNNKSTRMFDVIKTPPLMPLESGLEDSLSNLSVQSSSPPRTQNNENNSHSFNDCFKGGGGAGAGGGGRRADSLPRHLTHLKMILRQHQTQHGQTGDSGVSDDIAGVTGVTPGAGQAGRRHSSRIHEQPVTHQTLTATGSSQHHQQQSQLPGSQSSPNAFRSILLTGGTQIQEDSSDTAAGGGGVMMRDAAAAAAAQCIRDTTGSRGGVRVRNRISASEAVSVSARQHRSSADAAVSMTTMTGTGGGGGTDRATADRGGAVTGTGGGSFRRRFTDIERRAMVAMFDYNERTSEELSLRKGDRVYLLNEFDPEWWLVEHAATLATGYIPSSFVAPEGSLESQDWFISKISRKDSERLLMLQRNTQGTFLVRQSETSQGFLSLSVRDNEPNGSESVKHYKIRYADDMVCITTKCMFSSLLELVEFYSNDSNGLCCRLTRPCPRPAPVTTDLSFKTKDQWEISRSSIELVQKLGAGQFGEVWKGKWNNTTWVAVKTLKQGAMTTDEFLKEARIMKNLNHPKLVKLYAVCTDDPIYIVTELMTHGSLLAYLREGLGKNLEMKMLVDLMAQIACGMAFLEKERYIHRDLAARNILVGENNMCKVADFGLARMIRENSGTYEAKEGTKFPIKWTAPEAAMIGRFTIKSDVWSYGIVLYEIVTKGKVPYPSMNNTETLQEVEKGYRMPQPSECPSKIYHVMLTTWEQNPDERPTFEFLCQFFENYYVHAETNYKHAAANNASPTIAENLLQQHFQSSQEPELTAV